MDTQIVTNPTVKAGPKEVFSHLLAMLMLYFSAASFITLLYQLINIWLPDPLEINNYYYLEGARTGIRFGVASLIVVFPTFLLMTRYLNRLYEKKIEVRNMRIRKWLVYFTLFAAAAMILGDLVVLIYNLLGGEITSRFILKVLTILFVAGSIFYYYYFDLKRTKSE